MKQKMLVVGITMNAAGSEKSFLSFANSLDYERFDVDLLLAKKEGLFLDLLPKQIHILEMPAYGELFTLDGGSAARVIFNLFVKRNPFILFQLFPYVCKRIFSPHTAHDTATRLFCTLMQRMSPHPGHYDIALAYWGDKTMFYVCDKVDADKKIAWLHFDYENPPRDDRTYLHYFKQCDRLVTVSPAIDTSLRRHFPEIADRCRMMENINDPSLIRELSKSGETFQDTDYDGIRILTIGRIAPQKGYDLAVEALALLKNKGVRARYYIIGSGSPSDCAALKEQIERLGCSDDVTFLGTTVNPYRYLADCDIYAQPSRHEGKPISVEEAKILAKPILITEYLSARNQLENGNLGMIVPIDTVSIANGLEALITDTPKRMHYSGQLAKASCGNPDEISVFYDMLKGIDK